MKITLTKKTIRCSDRIIGGNTAPYYSANIKNTHLLTSLTLVQLSVYIRVKYDGKVYRIVLLLLSNITFYSSPVAFFLYFFASLGLASQPCPFSNIYEVN